MSIPLNVFFFFGWAIVYFKVSRYQSSFFFCLFDYSFNQLLNMFDVIQTTSHKSLCKQINQPVSHLKQALPIHKNTLANFLDHGSIKDQFGGARGVMVFIGGNGHSDTSSNPGRV